MVQLHFPVMLINQYCAVENNLHSFIVSQVSEARLVKHRIHFMRYVTNNRVSSIFQCGMVYLLGQKFLFRSDVYLFRSDVY